jgi:hypothetical protein
MFCKTLILSTVKMAPKQAEAEQHVLQIANSFYSKDVASASGSRTACFAKH